MPPLGSISSFSLSHRAGYTCYVRAAWNDTFEAQDSDSPCLADSSNIDDRPRQRTFILTDRIEGGVNLGDNVVRSLTDAGIPDGAEVGKHSSFRFHLV